MGSLDILAMGARNLWRRKVRSLLTVLGVIIGTAAIVVMISLSVGIEDALVKQFENMGDLSIVEVWPGFSGNERTMIDTEMMDKISAIEGVEVATPLMNSYARIIADRYEVTTSIMGIKPEALPYLGIEISEGRLLTTEDDLHMLFGSQVLPRFQIPRSTSNMRGGYYPDYNQSTEPPIDVMEVNLRLSYDMGWGDGNTQYELYRAQAVGIIGGDGYNRYSYSVIMPLDTVIRLEQENNSNNRSGGRYEPEFNQVMVKAATLDDIDHITASIQQLGLQSHSLSEMLEEAKRSTEFIRLILGGIGAISMLVAALGITNTMVMSIYERTREIGVMKVLGAKLADIGKMFLVESALIGFFGGVVGLGVSFGISYFLNNIIAGAGMIGIPMQARMSIIPPWLVILALVFTSSVGLIAGLYPAIRAMRLSALEAIRTE